MLTFKEYVSGYGGVAVQTCELNKEPMTVVYGHLRLSSIIANRGETLNAGEIIGVLGADKSAETDGERQHLHMGFHKGTEINLKGYVNSESELINWINPCLYVCRQ